MLLEISWIVGLLVAHSGIALFILLRVQKSGEKHPVEKLVKFSHVGQVIYTSCQIFLKCRSVTFIDVPSLKLT